MDPKVAQSLFQLCRAGDFHTVERRTRALLVAHPKESLLHSLHGAACLETGQCEAAIESYRKALALRPGLAKVHNSLGIAYLRTGRLEEAMESFGGAIDNDAQFAEPRFNLGLILENRQRLGEAANAYHQAVQLDPGYCKARCALAKVLWQAGQFEQVAEHYERALATDATFMPAHRGLLQFLEQSNRHDELREAAQRAGGAVGTEHPLVRYYQGVLADIDGRTAEARSLLESCHQEPTDPLSRHDERMRLARLTGICDRLNDIDAAMQYADGANRLAREASVAKGIDKAGFLGFIENRRRYYRPENIGDARWGEPPADPHRAGNSRDGGKQRQRSAPVFIVGFPRSGTTLIDTILRGHPGTAVAEESAALPKVVNQLCGPTDQHLWGLGELSGAAIERARRTYFDTLERTIRKTEQQDSRTGGAAASVDTDRRQAAAPAENPPTGVALMPPQENAAKHPDTPDINAASPFGAGACGTVASGTETGPRAIDRFALNIVYVGEIHRIFPNAKFILMLRHPADTVLSCYLRTFAETSANASFHTLEDAVHLYDQVFGLWRQFTNLFALDVIEIKYEDLIADLEQTSRKVLQFIDLPWHPGVLDHERTARTRGHIRTASYSQVIQPLYSDAAGRWRRYQGHLKAILPTLKPWMARFGYE